MTALPMTLMSDDEVAVFGRDDHAGFGALRTDRGLLPLVAMDVDVRVAGVIASIDVAQTFVNTTGAAIEATYIFPLPDRAAVRRFVMEVGGRIIEGVVEERGAAREQYDEAIARGQRAAITEEERPGVFTLRVGNLMPGDAATVRLSLVGPLPVDDGEVTFRFPLVVAPRYMPGRALGGDQAGLGAAADTSLVPDASRISPPVLLPGCPNPIRLGMRVALEDHDVRDVSSSLHAVTTAHRDAHVVEVHPGERLDRDFILRWRVDPRGAAVRSTLVTADDADGRAGTFLLTLVPPSTTTVAARPRDVVFVIDRSGSMEGWKMVAARRAAARMIDTLTSRDRFCAIAFDNVIELIPSPALADATDRTRYRAVEALAKIDARGGTELAEPLRRAAAMLAGGHDDRERVIVLVTDGQVGNEDHILRELAPNLRKIRMFTLGIDQAVNAAFLRRLAGAGGGLCELVESEDRLDAVMAKVHRRIGTPIATELTLRSAGLDVEAIMTAPSKLPDVYAGAPVTILGRYRGSAASGAAIEIEGTSLGDPMRMRITGTTIEARQTSWLPASWARARIRDLEDRYAAGERGTLEHDIVAVSKRYSVLSRFTAFLAVDRQVVNPGGKLNQIVQAVEQPAGWAGAAAPSGGGGVMKTMMGVPRPAPAPMMAQPQPMQPMQPMSPPPPPGAPMAGYNAASMPPRPTEAAPMPSYSQAPPSLGRAGGSAPPAPPSHGSYGSPPRPAPGPVSGAGAMRSRSRNEAERSKKEEGSSDKRGAAAPVDAAYLVTLATLARELETQGRGRADAAAIRVLRQRLTEWVEDVRSVGGQETLAAAVEQLVQRLSAALALGGDIATETIAVAGELAGLAAGGPPPAPKKSRLAFWK